MFAKTLTQVRAAITSWKLSNPTRNRLAVAYFFTRTSKVTRNNSYANQTSYRITRYSIRLWTSSSRVPSQLLQALNLSEVDFFVAGRKPLVKSVGDGDSQGPGSRWYYALFPRELKRTNEWINRFKIDWKEYPECARTWSTWAKFNSEPNHTCNNIETSNQFPWT